MKQGMNQGARLLSGTALLATTVSIFMGEGAYAQATSSPPSQGVSSILMEDIVVTATKRGEESAQAIPIAITAFGERQLEALNFRDISSLSYQMPNVGLDQLSSSPGFANFSIRGLGLNGSLVSLEPTVGTFVDGVYQGISAGLVFDNFDLAGVEVLRGPQGILFGRNVIGGAVLIKTTEPSQTLSGDFRAAIETGPNIITSGVMTGPISRTVSAKLAAYYSRDSGWFEDELDGTNIDRARTLIVRPALLWEPTGAFRLIGRFEHGENKGDGAPSQNLALYPRGSFKFANDLHGPYKSNWNQITAEANWDVGLGDGTLTNIAGWREFETVNHNDADGTPMPTFGTENRIWQHQFSNELRYAGTFGRLKITTGLFYFTQYMRILESRFLGPTTLTGGGKQSTESIGVFMAADYALTDTLTVNGGARYSYESKRARVANIDASGNCTLAMQDCAAYAFNHQDYWSDVSPRIGLQWKPVPNIQLYGYYAKGFRSGGYNLRQTNPLASPGPFAPETQNAFEVGLKSDLFDRKVRFNAALFLNKIQDLQRSVIVPDANVGLVQVLTNTADADVSGFEAELNLHLIPNLVVSGNVGYVHNKFRNILYDISNDGVLDEKDYDLMLPRLYPWTYSVSVVHDMELGDLGTLNSRISYNHRDAGYYDDANLGRYSSDDMIDVNVSLAMANGVTLSVYGKNLTNDVSEGSVSVLPQTPAFGGPGAVNVTLNKGRIIGGEVRYRF